MCHICGCSCCCKTTECCKKDTSKFFQGLPVLGTTNQLELIQGFEKTKLVSVDDALPERLRFEKILKATKNAYRNREVSSTLELTENEWRAIYIYVNEYENISVAREIFEALNSRDRTRIALWFPFLKILHNGLQKLEDERINIAELINGDPAQLDLWESGENSYYQLSSHPLNESQMAIVRSIPDDSAASMMKLFKNEFGGPESYIALIWPALAKTKNVNSMESSGRSQAPVDIVKQTNSPPEPDSESQPDREPDPDPSSSPDLKPKPDSPSQPDLEPKPDSPSQPALIPDARSTFDPITRPDSIPVLEILPVRRTKRLHVDWSKRHFICVRPYCKNECSQNHRPKRCQGFKYVFHPCNHHCDPKFRCYVCFEYPGKEPLHQCNQCGWLFCRNCSFINC